MAKTSREDFGMPIQVKLIRKLRWVGLEEKAEQLEKELEQQPATDTVLAIQSETD